MAVTKRVVCLANSRKLSGRCIAGKEFAKGKPGGWIRPVSSREHEEVSERERQYKDGSDPRVLDIVDVPLLKPKAKDYQQENWLIDPTAYWSKAGRVGLAELKALVDPIGALWVNSSSSYAGLHDRVSLTTASKLRTSLCLVRVDRLALKVFTPGEAFGDTKRRVQGRFKHDGEDYHLTVTDPIVERLYLPKADGDYKLGECYLTVSLGEPYKGYCYKLIAAIIETKDVK